VRVAILKALAQIIIMSVAPVCICLEDVVPVDMIGCESGFLTVC
jgi:hypothetical protein